VHIIYNEYFFLSKDVALVSGAVHSLLIDFDHKCTYRINTSSRAILELGENGFTISEALEKLKSEVGPSDIISFINQLAAKELICISPTPKTSKIDPYTPRLDFISIEVVSKCNLKCIHCYADSTPRKDIGLPSVTLKRVISEAAELGCKALQLTGGECLLREDLTDLIEHAKGEGFGIIEIFTNATMLTEDMVKFLANEGIQVATSIHSFRAEIHDAITGVPGSFESTLRNLKLLLSYGVPTRTATIAMRQNEDDLEATTTFLLKLGVQCKSPDPIRPRGRGLLSENWPKKYGLSCMLTEPSFCISKEDYEQNKLGNSCWRGKAAITSSGEVLPCVFARDNIVGNITRQNLAEIIYSECMQNLWSLSKDKVKVCKDCEYRYFCRDCRPWSYGLIGDLYAKYPQCTYNPYTGEWGTAEDTFGKLLEPNE
jgi:radical SAM protein with 4Fe4S-binding SPASM domain